MKNAGSVPGSQWHRAFGSSRVSQGDGACLEGWGGGLGNVLWATQAPQPLLPCPGGVSTGPSNLSSECRGRGSLQSFLPTC